MKDSQIYAIVALICYVAACVLAVSIMLNGSKLVGLAILATNVAFIIFVNAILEKVKEDFKK